LPAAVRGKGLHDCLFEDCGFVHVGSYGLELNQGCQHDRVIHCLFDDLGGGGIRLGEPAMRAVPLRTGGNEISRCTIRDGGKLFTSGEGLWLGQTGDNRILHNEISDFYYTAISMGATWSYTPTLSTNNLVEFNHVHHIGRKSNGDGPIHSDMGGLYTVGPSGGTVLRNNRVHDIAALSYGGLGIYFDESTSGILAENNLVYRTTDGSFLQHFGETNILRNNIFAFSQKGQLARGKSENHLQFTFEHNIVYYDSGTLLENNWKDDHFVMDYNLYWDTRAAGRPSALALGTGTWDQWRAQGYDVHSLIADPRFVDPQSGNFQLQSDSPAAQIGFKPFDVSTAGP
jgi:hypothetical protein